MERETKNSLAPFITLTFIYFIVIFLTTVNGQCQGPLKSAFLENAGIFTNTLTTLILFFFFLGYLVNSPLGGRWVNKVGYKITLLRALLFMIGGLVMFFSSSWFTVHFPQAILKVSDATIPVGFFIFLAGSFLMGTSAAISQVVINPYVAAYEIPGTQAVQRMNIVCASSSLGAMVAPFFVTTLLFGGRSIHDVEISQLTIPFILIAVFVTITTLVTWKLNIPDIKNTRASEENKLTRSIWSFRHFKLGVVAIFFYVGAEVAVGTNINLHALELIGKGKALSFFGSQHLLIGGIDFGIPALLATIYWGGMLIGRMVSSLMSKISPRTQLVFTTILSTILVSVAIVTNNLWLLALMGLFQSVMWSCIFTLAVKGLEEYTAKASGIFMMGVFGGAFFPVIQGAAADLLGSWRWTWSIAIVCQLVMLSYALVGSRIKEPSLDTK